ncbi:twin-arginine translocation signal domain-containing protein, partial [Sphaerisporangium melleum]|uniref:twin-arginine translocation signal domain-containing protein n=1 Tax=Sphaerisporangium melleum TaxID=321316 RepID=UPI003558E2E8
MPPVPAELAFRADAELVAALARCRPLARPERAWRSDMADLTRRQLMKFGAAGAGALLLPMQWTAAARAASVAPPEVRAAG